MRLAQDVRSPWAGPLSILPETFAEPLGRMPFASPRGQRLSEKTSRTKQWRERQGFSHVWAPESRYAWSQLPFNVSLVRAMKPTSSPRTTTLVKVGMMSHPIKRALGQSSPQTLFPLLFSTSLLTHHSFHPVSPPKLLLLPWPLTKTSWSLFSSSCTESLCHIWHYIKPFLPNISMSFLLFSLLCP